MSRIKFLFGRIVLGLPLLFFSPFLLMPPRDVLTPLPRIAEITRVNLDPVSELQEWETWARTFGHRQRPRQTSDGRNAPVVPIDTRPTLDEPIAFQPIGSAYQNGRLVLFVRNTASGRVVEIRAGESYLGMRLVSESAMGYIFDKEGKVVTIPK